MRWACEIRTDVGYRPQCESWWYNAPSKITSEVIVWFWNSARAGAGAGLVYRDISQINFFLSLVNAKRELFSPLVIVGSQIFERPSGGCYGGQWISDRYLKSNIYQIFGVQKKGVSYEAGSNPRPCETGSSHVVDIFRLTIGSLHCLYLTAI